VTGDVLRRFMNGATKTGGAYLPTVTDLTWQIVPTSN
jgi:hypothetical protein